MFFFSIRLSIKKVNLYSWLVNCEHKESKMLDWQIVNNSLAVLWMQYQCQKKIGKICAGLTYKLLLSFTVISDFYRSLFQIKIHLLSIVLLSRFQSSLVRQYLANFTGIVGIVNTIFYKTEPIFTGLRHGKLSQFLTLQYCEPIILPMLLQITYSSDGHDGSHRFQWIKSKDFGKFYNTDVLKIYHTDGLAQNCSNSIPDELELL